MLGAVADWATGKSKALKGDIEDLKLGAGSEAWELDETVIKHT